MVFGDKFKKHFDSDLLIRREEVLSVLRLLFFFQNGLRVALCPSIWRCSFAQADLFHDALVFRVVVIGSAASSAVS